MLPSVTPACCAVWDQGRLSRYNFLWTEAATYAHYTAETAYTDTALLRKSTVTVAGMGMGSCWSLTTLTRCLAALVVMKSLTHNGRKAYWTLLKHQHENASTPSFQGTLSPHGSVIRESPPFAQAFGSQSTWACASKILRPMTKLGSAHT